MKSPTILEDGKRLWIYPDRQVGFFSNLRKKIAFVLIVIYILVPWLSIDGRPFIRFDALSGQIFLVGHVFRFIDGNYFAFIFLLAAVSLFLVTSLKGRLWCGFACPQTVFIEWVIRPIEEFLEGSAFHRKLRDKKKLTWDLIAKKLLKHSLFFGLAFFLANSLLAYFVDPHKLLQWMSSSPIEHWKSFSVMSLVTLGLYFDFSWFREQFCAFVCPYAKFQVVMIDKNTPSIAYDSKRGEPRGKKNTGDCIDCGFCTRVCPTGIDIRNGLQLECIQCFRCADACNRVMASLDRPKGLIRLASQGELETGVKSNLKKQLLQPKHLMLSVTFVMLLGILVVRLVSRNTLDFVSIRQPGAPYTLLDHGSFTNAFTINITNHINASVDLNLEAERSSVEIICGGCATPLTPFERRSIALIIKCPPTFKDSKLFIHMPNIHQSFQLPILGPMTPKN